MNVYLKTLILSFLCFLFFSGCNNENSGDATEPVNMAGALFTIDENEFTLEKQYKECIISSFNPKQIEIILCDRLSESNALSGEKNFIGTHPYQILIGESFAFEEKIPDYIYVWIEDLNILKKIYRYNDNCCDFNPDKSMETEYLDENVVLIYEDEITLKEDTKFYYAVKDEFENEYQTFETIIKSEIFSLLKETPKNITIHMMNGFSWEFKAGGFKAYAEVYYKNGKSEILELYPYYDENGKPRLKSQHIGNDLNDFPNIEKKCSYEYTLKN